MRQVLTSKQRILTYYAPHFSMSVIYLLLYSNTALRVAVSDFVYMDIDKTIHVHLITNFLWFMIVLNKGLSQVVK